MTGWSRRYCKNLFCMIKQLIVWVVGSITKIHLYVYHDLRYTGACMSIMTYVIPVPVCLSWLTLYLCLCLWVTVLFWLLYLWGHLGMIHWWHPRQFVYLSWLTLYQCPCLSVTVPFWLLYLWERLGMIHWSHPWQFVHLSWLTLYQCPCLIMTCACACMSKLTYVIPVPVPIGDCSFLDSISMGTSGHDSLMTSVAVCDMARATCHKEICLITKNIQEI